jgi:hypothetical protein
LLDPTVDVSNASELSGNVGYFASSEILQMLEVTGATGILYFDRECAGKFICRTDESVVVFRKVSPKRKPLLL